MRDDEKITRVVALAVRWCEVMEHFSPEDPETAKLIDGWRAALPVVQQILRDQAAAGTLRAYVKDPLNRREAATLARSIRYFEGVYLTEEYSGRAEELGLVLPERV